MLWPCSRLIKSLWMVVVLSLVVDFADKVYQEYKKIPPKD